MSGLIDQGKLARLVGQAPQTVETFWGVVTAITSGTTPTLTLNVNGSTAPVTALYDQALQPQVGDTVYGRVSAGARGPDYLVEGITATAPGTTWQTPTFASSNITNWGSNQPARWRLLGNEVVFEGLVACSVNPNTTNLINFSTSGIPLPSHLHVWATRAYIVTSGVGADTGCRIDVNPGSGGSCYLNELSGTPSSATWISLNGVRYFID